MLKATGKALSLIVFTAAVAVTFVGCGGGDGDNNGVSILVTQVTVDPDPTIQGAGIICFDVTVQGPPNTIFNILAEYQILGAVITPLAPMTEASNTNVQPPIGLQGLGTTSDGTGPFTTDQNGAFTFRFCWSAVQDLGIIVSDLRGCFTPYTASGSATNPDGGTGCSDIMNFDSSSGAAPIVVSGPPLPPRTYPRPNVHHVRDGAAPGSGPLEELLVTGSLEFTTEGASGDGQAGANRFTFDRNDPTGPSFSTTSNPYSGMILRVYEASAFYLDPTDGLIRVLVTGGVDGADPNPFPGNTPPDLATLVNGASDSDSVDIYSFIGGSSSITPAQALPDGARFGHTATWIPDNRVIVIGGARGTGMGFMGLDSILAYDPDQATPGWQSPGPSATLASPRVLHTATLLPDGQIFIFGGYDPANASTELPTEIYDPVADTISSITAPVGVITGRTQHTVTRLQNGTLLIVGGRDLSGDLIDQAVIFDPIGPNWTTLTMAEARAAHTATLMGNGQVLIAGGVTPDSGGGAALTPPEGGAIEQFTSNIVVYTPGVNTFTPTAPLTTPRAEHAAGPGDGGNVYIIGGRNAAGSPAGLNFLTDIEFYAFSNTVPSITSTATSTAPISQMVNIDFDVQDADQDGGFVFIRWRDQGSMDWQNATIDSQIMPDGTVVFPPTFQIMPGDNTFRWNWAADGATANQVVEIQLIPVGAVLGSPATFTAVPTSTP